MTWPVRPQAEVKRPGDGDYIDVEGLPDSDSDSDDDDD
jgi:hypothetical protein